MRQSIPSASILSPSRASGRWPRSSRAYPRHTHDKHGIGIVDSGGHASFDQGVTQDAHTCEASILKLVAQHRILPAQAFARVCPERKTTLLRTCWSIPERQIEDLVLASPPLDRDKC